MCELIHRCAHILHSLKQGINFDHKVSVLPELEVSGSDPNADFPHDVVHFTSVPHIYRTKSYFE